MSYLYLVIGIIAVVNISAWFVDQTLKDGAVFRWIQDSRGWRTNFAREGWHYVLLGASKQFTDLFDAIYGSRPVSIKRIVRSTICSLLAIVLVSILADPMSTFPFSEIISGKDIGIVLSVTFFLNPLIDYFSLLETRWILTLAARGTLKRIIFLGFFDLALTTFIFYVGLNVYLFFHFGILFDDWSTNVMSLGKFIRIITSPQEAQVFFISTFFTSVLWFLYVGFVIVVKIIDPLFSVSGKILDRIFDSHRPAQLVSGILSSVFILGYVFSLVGVHFSRQASVEVKIAIFALMFAGFAGFVLLAFTRYRTGATSGGKTKEIRPTDQSEKGGLRAKADERYKDAEKSRISGRNDQARSAYEEARALFKQAGDRLGVANVLRGLGDLERMLGRNDQARLAYEEARTLFKQVGDRLGEASVLRGLGDLERMLGRNDQARSAYGEARTFFKQVGGGQGEANVLLGLGDLESMLGRNDQARSAYEEARTLFKQEQNSLGEAHVLRGLGGLEAETEPEMAKQHLYQAAHIYESIGLEEHKRTALEEAAKLGR